MFCEFRYFPPADNNPHQVLDYGNWWNKSLNNIKPYRIPPLSNDIVTKLHNQLGASSDRIWRTRSAEEATKIIELLRESLSTLTQKSTHTSFHGTYPCTKTRQKNQTRYTAEIQLLCCIYFKLFASTNHIFCFPTTLTITKSDPWSVPFVPGGLNN